MLELQNKKNQVTNSQDQRFEKSTIRRAGMRKSFIVVCIAFLLATVHAYGQSAGSGSAGIGTSPMVELNIGQIDTSQYPTIRIYIDIYDANGKLVTNVDPGALQVREKDSTGKEVQVTINDLYQVFQKEKISFSLVLDKSGSMGDNSKIFDAKAAVYSLIDEIAKQKKDTIEVASFNDYVYLDQEFTTDYELVKRAVEKIGVNKSTALYDAIYSALLRLDKQTGPKCVVVFTDGKENASSYTRQDLLRLGSIMNTPVYIIGIGQDVAQNDLSDLAPKMLGRYYFVDVVNLRQVLTEVYHDIFLRQKNRYAIQYTVSAGAERSTPRSIQIRGKNVLAGSAGSERKYIANADVNTSFSGTYWNSDFIFPSSSKSTVTEADLRPLSLAEMRIARNEIFARHGRQFKDPMLNKWFYSKAWYLRINPKYSPAEFDARPDQMNAVEKANIAFILKTEQNRMKNQTIFPDASTRVLSEYDVSLSKDVLKKALKEIYDAEKVPVGQKTSLSKVALKNVQQIEVILNTSDIKY